VRIDALHRWGSGLASNGASEDLRAAGRAIQLLVEHIEELELTRTHDAETGGDGSAVAPPEGDAPPRRGSFLGALADRIGTQP
jgi:hypothetical protein